MIGCLLRRVVLFSVFVAPTACWPCSVSHITTNEELVMNADLIVRAKATEYATPPADQNVRTNGITGSIVRFQVLEVIRGGPPTSTITLHGYLGVRDDFNDQKPPYTFARPGGRSGSCFANSYRKDAEYLLFLKGSGTTGELTANWAALAPVNEQLRESDDLWLPWVRERAKKH